MRQSYSGSGANTTAAAQSFLLGTSPLIKNLYIIGRPEFPSALFMTDYETPLSYGLFPQNNFSPATVTRGDIPCKIGLDAETVSIEWSPGGSSFSNNITGANPRTLAMQGYYDNWPVQILAGLMPTPGDVNTIGCVTLFRGLISSTEVDRKSIRWTVDSLLALLDQQVPTNVIEATNSLANYTAATPPAGFSTIPRFTIFTGSTASIVYGDVLPPYGSHHIFPAHSLQGGYMIFAPDNAGATLPLAWAAIADNTEFIDLSSVHHNQFQLYQPLPWAPSPWSGSSGDQFIVSSKAATVGGSGYSFNYVPAPEAAA